MLLVFTVLVLLKETRTNFGVGESIVIEAVQDVTGALFELKNEHTKFPVSEAETIGYVLKHFPKFPVFPANVPWGD